MAQFTVNSQRPDPYMNYKFRVKWDGRYVAGISKVTGLKRNTEVVKHGEGGDPNTGRRAPGTNRYGAIILERGIIHDLEFEQWANRVMNDSSGLGSEASLKDFRRDITIELYNEARQRVVAYNVFRCWVSEFQAMPDLDANANTVTIQHMRLENEGWERDCEVTEPPEPSSTEPAAEASLSTYGRKTGDPEEDCRGRVHRQLNELAVRIESAVTWEDLVLPPAQIGVLKDIAARLRQQAPVCQERDFIAKSDPGFGISALFTGESGTGKTMAAEVLAHELRLDLYLIDLSQAVSNYIGEAEKNLRRVFDAAEDGGIILFFDEADSLFGERSEVKDSDDRYANIEVNYLLQRMETYCGLSILATNMKNKLDSVFLRRLCFVVQFPFPDAGHRTDIWRRVFPDRIPTENLDYAKLAKLNIAGGNIRNIAMNGAFLASQNKTAVRMSHLLEATRAEYAKLGKPLMDSEIGGWV